MMMKNVVSLNNLAIHVYSFNREFGPAQDYVPTRQLSLKSFGGRPGFTGGSGGQQRTRKPKAKQDLFTKILTIKVSPLVYYFDCKKANCLTHNMAVKPPSFLPSKWNLYLKSQFFGRKMMVKSGLGKIFLKFLHAEVILF